MHVSFKTQLIMSDILLDTISSQEKGVIFAVWLQETGWSNFDFEAQKYFMKQSAKMGDASASMIHKVMMVDAPWYVWVVMKLIHPFMPKEMQNMNQTISSEQLLIDYDNYQMPIDELIEIVKSRTSFWV